jgi:hypothetical protein
MLFEEGMSAKMSNPNKLFVIACLKGLGRRSREAGQSVLSSKAGIRSSQKWIFFYSKLMNNTAYLFTTLFVALQVLKSNPWISVS